MFFRPFYSWENYTVAAYNKQSYFNDSHAVSMSINSVIKSDFLMHDCVHQYSPHHNTNCTDVVQSTFKVLVKSAEFLFLGKLALLFITRLSESTIIMTEHNSGNWEINFKKRYDASHSLKGSIFNKSNSQ